MTAKLGIGAVLALALAACGGPQPATNGTSPQQQQARTVSVVKVEMRPIAGGLVTSGLLAPRQQVEVSPDLAGYRVAKLYVEEGDWVRAGQPLAQLDGSILQAQLDQQVAQVNALKATADERQAEADRVKGLDTQGILATEQVQDRRFTATNARAAVTAQEAAVLEMQTRLAHMTIRAPVSGQIIQRNVNLGDISGAGGTAWFVMAQDGQIELFADIAEGDFAQMRPGLRAKVTLADATTADGVVRLVSPRVDTTTRLGHVRISLPVRPDIRAGGYAQASFEDLSRAVVAVPETAVRYDASGASVMTVAADGKVSQTPVRTGERGGGYVELLSGPAAGQTVVAKAAAQLLPGDYIRPDWSGAAP
ncbi:MAG TPA: efflux RND transporter periplasmic adaptor subunit [Caulobacteraceae bacterium]|jgi:HlyD family secretion protein|nr:efflux RND transporter periplasmic adaptor subunit [Caulobacteraceae bacterium]